MRFPIDRQIVRVPPFLFPAISRFAACAAGFRMLLAVGMAATLLAFPALQAQDSSDSVRIVRRVDAGKMVPLGGHFHPYALAWQ